MKSERYRDYLLEYYHNGAKWNVTIPATSFEDAHERAQQLYYAKVLGTVEAVIPARLGILVRATCWLRSRLSYLSSSVSTRLT
jgi:hypothetical protein